jgi:hypothetical protein
MFGTDADLFDVLVQDGRESISHVWAFLAGGFWALLGLLADSVLGILRGKHF